MFYQVRVLDSKNQLKKIIPVKELRIKHWVEYEKKTRGICFTTDQKNINN